MGNDPRNIMDGFDEVMNGGWKKGEIPPKWDGKAASRIVETLERGKHRTLERLNA